MGGQSSEEAAELVATIRGEHVVMKNWFMGNTQDAVELRDKYGPYPSLWKEVLNWPGWKEARKSYLKFTQQQQNNQGQQQQQRPQDNEAAQPRKRRSRWGVASGDNNNDHHHHQQQPQDRNGGNNNHYGNPDHHHPDEGPPSKRRSRWGRDGGGGGGGGGSHHDNDNHHHQQHTMHSQQNNNKPVLKPLPGLGLPGMPTNLSPQQQEEFARHQTRLRDVNTQLDNVDREAARVDSLPRGHRERSPSPPPVYGADGKRKNTRAVRWRQRLTSERQDILEKLMNLNPATRQSGLFKRKRTNKIRIPVEDHPQYNFIGLIIGPRGKTQKELESKTGCKIAIRGRGSVKEGARGRRDGKVMESDDEPLHVVITGDDQRSVDAATDMIQQMLVVIDDEKNVHKQQQLRELALLNGTLKEDEFCQICAEKGHRSFECPKRFSMKAKSTGQVRCAICGDTSHPTQDCRQKPGTNYHQGPTNVSEQKEMDSDYMSFMAELDGKKVDKQASSGPPGAPQLPPPPTGLPPPPVGGGGASAGLPPPPPPGLPPPPTAAGGLPPPVPASAGGAGQYYGNQQHYGGGGGGNPYGPPPTGVPPPAQPPVAGGAPGASYYGNAGGDGYNTNHSRQQPPPNTSWEQQQQWQQQQQQQGYHDPQQQQQGQGGRHSQQAWDYEQYYGSGGRGGDAGGAGGFNWWENS